MLVLQERHPCTFLHAFCHYSCVAYPERIVVRFGRHDAFYLWQVWWSAQAGRKGRHELCSSQPHKPPTNHPARPLMQKFFRCAGQIAAPCGASYSSWGEARRKRLQVRTKSTKTRSSPRRFRNWRSRSSILNGAGAASGRAPEQRLCRCPHSKRARLKPRPRLGLGFGLVVVLSLIHI